jgi:hypothetical protein
MFASRKAGQALTGLISLQDLSGSIDLSEYSRPDDEPYRSSYLKKIPSRMNGKGSAHTIVVSEVSAIRYIN